MSVTASTDLQRVPSGEGFKVAFFARLILYGIDELPHGLEGSILHIANDRSDLVLCTLSSNEALQLKND